MSTSSDSVAESISSVTPFSFNLESIAFSDGTHVEFEKNDLVVIVGGNNAGKSQALRDIRAYFSHDVFGGEYQGVVVNSVKSWNTEELTAVENWLGAQDALSDLPDARVANPARGTRHPRRIALEWFGNNSVWRRQLFAAHCIELLDTETRLSIANPAPSISYSRGDAVDNPIQHLYRNEELELELSSYFREAFGVDVVVNRGDGATIPLHCGERPQRIENEDRVSSTYIERLLALPLAHKQGDGMRSFLGSLLRVFVWKPFVTLLDEPEAFLHPPQARYLGALLANKKPKDRQIIVSTHSGDFLRGVLDANSKAVRIIRLTREGNINKPIELNGIELNALWSDPLLRHSNLLDGVFHDGVVLCEADTDCQFYSAVMEAVVQNQPTVRRPHLLFAHVGGKDRFKSIIPALRCLGVPLRVVADFDLLSSPQPLRDIVSALGSEWSDYERDFSIIQAAMRGQKKELSREDVRVGIEQILAAAGQTISESDAEKIRLVVKRGSPWALAKTSGKSFIPAGDATQAYNRLYANLFKIGIRVVEVGEMESFCRSIGGHGTKWVSEAMKRNLANELDFQEARAFVAGIWQIG